MKPRLICGSDYTLSLKWDSLMTGGCIRFGIYKSLIATDSTQFDQAFHLFLTRYSRKTDSFCKTSNVCFWAEARTYVANAAT